MKKLILIMLVAFGFSFNASAQKRVICSVDTSSNGFTTLGTSFNLTSGASDTAYVFASATDMTTFATIQLKVTKVSGTTIVNTQPIVSNDGVTWTPLIWYANAADSVDYKSGYTGVTTRIRSYPLGYRYIGQRVVVSGSSGIVTVSGVAYIK